MLNVLHYQSFLENGVGCIQTYRKSADKKHTVSCPNCGSPLLSGSKYCTGCGSAVVAGTQSGVSAVSVPRIALVVSSKPVLLPKPHAGEPEDKKGENE